MEKLAMHAVRGPGVQIITHTDDCAVHAYSHQQIIEMLNKEVAVQCLNLISWYGRKSGPSKLNSSRRRS